MLSCVSWFNLFYFVSKTHTLQTSSNKLLRLDKAILFCCLYKGFPLLFLPLHNSNALCQAFVILSNTFQFNWESTAMSFSAQRRRVFTSRSQQQAWALSQCNCHLSKATPASRFNPCIDVTKGQVNTNALTQWIRGFREHRTTWIGSSICFIHVFNLDSGLTWPPHHLAEVVRGQKGFLKGCIGTAWAVPAQGWEQPVRGVPIARCCLKGTVHWQPSWGVTVPPAAL